MNQQRFVISVAAVFIFFFAYEFVVHGHLMMPLYTATPIWRPDDAMREMMSWSIGFALALSFAITWLFTRHYENKGLHEGARFGFYIGLIMALVQVKAFVYLPIPLNLALAWFAIWVLEGVGAGIVLSAVYRA